MSTRHFTSPLSCGIIRPTILLPEGITEKLSKDELKLMLYHELGHIKKMDMLTNCLQLIVQVIHFYNPLIWYVNRKIRLEREIACDDLVLHTTQGNNKAYADTLVKIVELTSKDARWFSLGIVGVTEPFINMKSRLIEIMKEGRQISTKLSFQSAIFILLFGLLSMPLYSADANHISTIYKREG
ncbi:MAG: M56 family metallopeptidase, partial [Candidatus Omnitrophica bacterium]|nr:M56 family metallopeptidase [Candidatus Omnitrophota bacterium]